MSENGIEDEEENNNETKVDAWVKIQHNTFANWMNDKLKVFDLEVHDLKKELRDGVMLCKLMNVLKGKSIGKIKEKKNMNHYEASGNLGLALNAMREDGVKLVNIGAEDISEGNIKLILGMLWILIRRYQIGSQSSLPPKKLMLSWVNAVLHPHRKVHNFDKDWNDGIALFGVLEYCETGLSPDWFDKSGRDKLANCAQAMTIANEQLNIPMVVDPQNFSSRDLDELSGMTYLSYFMAKDAPGYRATLNWVKGQIPSTPVDNFDRDWNNGYVLTSLVKSLGADVPDADPQNWIGTVKSAMDESKAQLSVEPVIPPKDMVQENVDHIGVMAYAAWHQHVVETVAPARPPSPIPLPITPEILVTPASPLAEPEPEPEPEAEPEPPILKIEEPKPVVIPPKKSKVITAVHKWRINSYSTIVVNTHDTALGQGKVIGRAISPSGENVNLYSNKVDDHLHQLSFPAKDAGVWTIHILTPGQDDALEHHLEGSPFNITVYDVSKVQLMRDTDQTTLEHMATYQFHVDCSEAHISDLTVYVLYDGESMEYSVTDKGGGMYQATFPGHNLGEYTVAIYSGGLEVPRSPFHIMVREVEGVWAEGDGLVKGDVGKDSSFIINFKEKLGGFLKVRIMSPNNEEIDAIVRNEETGLVRVQYTPLIPGKYQVDITYDDLIIKDSPFEVNVTSGKVFIEGLNKSPEIAERSSFILDASEAGKGTLEIDSDLPILLHDKVGERRFQITFVPKKVGKHDLLIKYNGIVVEGCPCEIDVQDNHEAEPVANGSVVNEAAPLKHNSNDIDVVDDE